MTAAVFDTAQVYLEGMRLGMGAEVACQYVLCDERGTADLAILADVSRTGWADVVIFAQLIGNADEVQHLLEARQAMFPGEVGRGRVDHQ